MNLFKTIFHSIYVHVDSISALQTCCCDYSRILTHILFKSITNHSQLMVHTLHLWYC